MTDEYVVYWNDYTSIGYGYVTKVVEAESPEEAAEKAVDKHVFVPDTDGVEVTVAEPVLERHDVLVDEN